MYKQISEQTAIIIVNPYYVFAYKSVKLVSCTIFHLLKGNTKLKSSESEMQALIKLWFNLLQTGLKLNGK